MTRRHCIVAPLSPRPLTALGAMVVAGVLALAPPSPERRTARGAVTRQAPRYHVVRTDTLGGEGGWDYVLFDSATRRLFIGRSNRIMVVSADSGTLLGEVPGLVGAHGAALAPGTGHGFATSGRDGSVVMFDSRTLEVLGRIPAADDADAILYDPASRRVFTFNGDAHSSTVIDPATGKRTGTIPLGAKPEFAVADGRERLYVNLEDAGAVAEVDSKRMRVTRRWPIAPCEEPTGLAIDREHQRLFSGCRNRMIAVSDAAAGRLVTTVPAGAGIDGNAFDPGPRDAFSANGADGTLTVVHEDSPTRFRVVETVSTARGARTMTLDPARHRIFLVTARFGPAPSESTAANPRRRPPIVPGSFVLLTVERR